MVDELLLELRYKRLLLLHRGEHELLLPASMRRNLLHRQRRGVKKSSVARRHFFGVGG